MTQGVLRFLVCILALFIGGTAARAQHAPLIVIIFDGYPYTVMQDAVADGAYSFFKSVAPMFAAFPTESDNNMKILRDAIPESAIYIEGNSNIQYLANHLLKQQPLRVTREALDGALDRMQAENNPTAVVYISMTDAYLHEMGRDEQLDLLKNMSDVLETFNQKYTGVMGDEAEIVILSDHGHNQIMETESVPWPRWLTQQQAQEAGQQQGHHEHEHDITLHRQIGYGASAIIGWHPPVELYNMINTSFINRWGLLRNPLVVLWEQVSCPFAWIVTPTQLSEQTLNRVKYFQQIYSDKIELVFYVDTQDPNAYVVVGSHGESVIRSTSDMSAFSYEMIHGTDPLLEYEQVYARVDLDERGMIGKETMWALTREFEYPIALERIVWSLRHQADVFQVGISLAPGVGPNTPIPVRPKSSHGELRRASSSAVFMSTQRDFSARSTVGAMEFVMQR